MSEPTLREALERIANLDYRGNRSPEQDIARAALAATPPPLDVEATPGHEHYWVDPPDDETAWHCIACGLTEYPGDPGIGQTGQEAREYTASWWAGYQVGHAAGTNGMPSLHPDDPVDLAAATPTGDEP